MENETDSSTVQERKMFVGGLSLDTDQGSMREYFSQYGDIDDCVMVRDGVTQKSRGFAFPVLSTLKGLEDCLKDKPHTLDGKEAKAKKAVPWENSRR